MSSLEPRPGHVVELPELPACDICKVEPAAWDTPLRGYTAWAYQCEGCNELLGANDGQTGVGIGQRLVARQEPTRRGELARKAAREVGD